MGLSQIPLLPLQHCHAAGALLLASWPSGAECPLGVAAEEDWILDSHPPPLRRRLRNKLEMCSIKSVVFG